MKKKGPLMFVELGGPFFVPLYPFFDKTKDGKKITSRLNGKSWV